MVEGTAITEQSPQIQSNTDTAEAEIALGVMGFSCNNSSV